MSEKKSVTNGGIGFAGLLAIVFITLKLLNVIDWSWGWVLAPIWIQIVILLLCFIVFIAYFIIKKARK